MVGWSMPVRRSDKVPAVTLVEDVGDLRAFGLVSDLRSVTAAALVLGESKATTSRRITRLESSLGVALIRRTSRVVEMTDEGRSYRQRISEVLELLADANAGVRNLYQVPHGHLRIAASSDLNRFLAPLLATFAERQPQVQIEMVVSGRRLDLDVERIDVAFRFGHRASERDGESMELLELELIWVATPSYLAATRGLTRMSELSQHRLLVHQAIAERAISFEHVKTGETTEIKAQPFISSNDGGLIVDIALESAGVALVPSILVQRELADGRLKRVLPEHLARSASLGLVFRSGQYVPAKVAAFRDFVRGRVRELAC